MPFLSILSAAESKSAGSTAPRERGDENVKRAIAPRKIAEARPSPCPPVLAAILALARTPALRHQMRHERVPAGTKQLFRFLDGNPNVISEAVRLTGKDPHFLQAAIIFYIEEVLWVADADPYRVIGLNPDAPFEVVSRHVDVILDWLSIPKNRRDRASDLARLRFAWQSIDSTSAG